MSTNYSALINNVQIWLQRRDETDLQEALPYLVSLAIQRITNDSEVLGGVTYVTGSLTANNPVLFKPYPWRDNMSFYIGTGPNFTIRKPIILRSYDYLTNYWTDDTKVEQPLYFADYDYSTWKIAPTPDQNYPFEISYYNIYTPLSIENETNWLTQYADNVLFYATMLEAYFFLQDEDNFNATKTKYVELLSAMIDKDQKRMQDRYANRAKD